MDVVKVKLLLVTLLSLTVGTVGSATAQQISSASADSTRVFFNTNQTATKAGENNSANMISDSASPATQNQIATAPTVQYAQASYQRTVQPTPQVLATAALTTLSVGEDLRDVVERASGVVLLDFYADWCGPCRTQGGILHEMEQTAMQNSASIIKVNVDQHRRLANAFNVTSMPTLILIKDGQIIERQSGVANHQRVAALLSK